MVKEKIWWSTTTGVSLGDHLEFLVAHKGTMSYQLSSLTAVTSNRQARWEGGREGEKKNKRSVKINEGMKKRCEKEERVFCFVFFYLFVFFFFFFFFLFFVCFFFWFCFVCGWLGEVVSIVLGCSLWRWYTLTNRRGRLQTLLSRHSVLSQQTVIMGGGDYPKVGYTNLLHVRYASSLKPYCT